MPSSYEKKKSKTFDPLTDQKENEKFIQDEHEKAIMKAILRHGALPMPHWTDEEIESWRRGEQIDPNRRHVKAKTSLMSLIMEWMAQVLAMLGITSAAKESEVKKTEQPQHAARVSVDKDAEQAHNKAEQIKRSQSHLEALQKERHDHGRGM